MALPSVSTRRYVRAARIKTLTKSPVNPFRIHKFQQGSVRKVPDIIEFVTSDEYLDRPNLYPRQATLLKIITLQKELFTPFDLDVIGDWEQTFLSTGTEGISPGIHDRIDMNIADGRHWFRETQAVVGRRGSKGYLGGLLDSYVLWYFMQRPGGPQNYYGVDRDKRLTATVFAGRKEQARDNQWRDFVNVVLGGPCFSPYISRPQAERLTVFAPIDILRTERQKSMGIETDVDQASFEIIPAPSTIMAARGPANFILNFDEQAHVISSTSNADASQVYDCLDPATRVLMADLTWRPIDEVHPGDEVIGTDEKGSGKTGSPRKLRKATVVGRGEKIKPGYRVSFDDGTSVVCSGTHRWLRYAGAAKDFKWGSIEKPEGLPSHWWPKLEVGAQIKAVVDPWEVGDAYDDGYLSGMFDGEGHIIFPERGSFILGFTQNPGPVLDKVRSLLIDRGFNFAERDATESRCRIITLSGYADGLRLLGQIRPIRLLGKAQDHDGRAIWEGRAFRKPSKTVVSIEPVEAMRMVDIETTTKTFVAEGLVSHNSATPSLDQFGRDGFIYAPSSPWAKTGKFFENYELAIEMENGKPVYPERLMIQLPSWGPYEDWEDASRIPMRPSNKTEIITSEVEVKKRRKVNGKTKTVTVWETREIEQPVPGPTFQPLKKAVQSYDDDMRKLERANPETFKVERRSIWSESINAYLNADKVRAVFEVYEGNFLTTQRRGTLDKTYVAAGDPSSVNKRFGWAIGHRVWVEKDQMHHVVLDWVNCWDPADFDDHMLDYDVVLEEIEEDVVNFLPEEVIFDQFNTPGTVGRLRKFLAKEQLPKSTRVHEVTRTRPVNWRHFELMKAAINMGLVHAPMYKSSHRDENGELDDVHFPSEELQKELLFLEEKCYDDQTEVLTEQGWLLFRDVPEGVRVATRSPAGVLEWRHPLARIDSAYSGELKVYQSGSLDFAVTPNHRMLVGSSQVGSDLRIVEADNLTAQRYAVPVRHGGDIGGDDTLRVTFGRLWPDPLVRQGRFYSLEDEQLLLEHYETVPTSHLASVLGRSEGSVVVRAHKMGLKKSVRWGTRPLTASVKDFAAFIGMWIADGSKTRLGHGVEISQKKPGGVIWIDNLLSRLGWEVHRCEKKDGSVSWRVHSHELHEYVRGLVGPTGLILPRETFTEWGPETRAALLDGLLNGDGCWGNDEGRWIGFIAEHESLTDDVHHLMVTLGMNARKTLLRRERPLKDMYYLRIKSHSRAIIETDRIESLSYDGRIYCFTVPNGTLMVRRNGKAMWCGNSGAVSHPSSGPVQTKDISDAFGEVVVALIGREMATFLGQELDGLGLSGMAPLGTDPGRHTRSSSSSSDAADRLGRLTSGRGRGDAGGGAARGMRRR